MRPFFSEKISYNSCVEYNFLNYQSPETENSVMQEHVGPWPVLPTRDLAKKAVHTALKRERNVVVPFW